MKSKKALYRIEPDPWEDGDEISVVEEAHSFHELFEKYFYEFSYEDDVLIYLQDDYFYGLRIEDAQ